MLVTPQTVRPIVRPIILTTGTTRRLPKGECQEPLILYVALSLQRGWVRVHNALQTVHNDIMLAALYTVTTVHQSASSTRLMAAYVCMFSLQLVM